MVLTSAFNLVMFTTLALLWNNNTWPNIFVRFLLVTGVFANAIELFTLLGYVVKV